MNWIKCSDRFPQRDEKIGYTFDGEIKHGQWFCHYSKQFQEYYGMDYYGNTKKEVTHWMPLPNLPE